MSDTDTIRWGWLGKLVATIVITGLPTLIITVSIAAIRSEHRMTVMEETLRATQANQEDLTRLLTDQDRRLRNLEAEMEEWRRQRAQRGHR